MYTYLHVHKQPFRAYPFGGHEGDLGLGGELGE